MPGAAAGIAAADSRNRRPEGAVRGGPGQAIGLDGNARVDGPAIPAVNATFRAANSCAPPRQTVIGPITTSSAQCAGGREVRLVSIAGGGHTWPTSPYNATAQIWRFFAAHPR